MAVNEDQLDIRDTGCGSYRLEFPYNEDFIAFLKMKVPPGNRQYDPDTHIWTIRGVNYLPHLESVGLQKFAHVTRIYRKDGNLVIRNVRTGVENTQKGLF